MKTKLLFASALALVMASCSQDEQLVQTPAGESKGITFEATVDGGADTKAATSARTDGMFDVRWFADKDKIAILYKQNTAVKPSTSDASRIGSTTWMGWDDSGTASPFIFRTTASGGKGYFAADSDEDMLELSGVPVATDGSDVPVFRAYWPNDLPRTDAEVTLPTLDNQTQTTANGAGIIDDYSFMYSETKSASTFDNVNGDNSVSKDRLLLDLKRATPIVYFKVKATSDGADDLNREYNRDYASQLMTNLGGLASISLEARGYTPTSGKATPASTLTYGTNATWNMAKAELADGFTDGTTGKVSKVTTELNFNQTGQKEVTAFMVIADVNRKAAFRDRNVKEKMVGTYSFGSVKFATDKTTIETFNDWEGNGWVPFPSSKGYSLDEEPYIVYPYGSANPAQYALEINPSFTGKLEDIFDKSDHVKGIETAGTSPNAIAKSSIKHFVSKIDITTDEDFDTIKSLGEGKLTHVTLLSNTTIPAEAFKGLEDLTYLNLPKVTTVDNENAFPDNAEYTEVYMGSYNFADDAARPVQAKVREILLNKKHLVKADVAGVEGIGSGFPGTGVTFQGFEKLEEITVANNVIVSGNGFDGCIVLKDVKFQDKVTGGSVTLETGDNSQFLNCKTLKGIAISNKVIPGQAFKGCTTLASIVESYERIDVDNNNVETVPTAIGVSAFEGCEALVDIDLRYVTTMGKAAFKGCKKLVGNNNYSPNGKVVLYLDALKHVPDEAFDGCSSLEYISFKSAETIGVKILNGTSPYILKEVEFWQPFTVNSSVVTTSTTVYFNNLGTLKLFCSKRQNGIELNNITLIGNAEGSTARTMTIGGGISQKYD